MSTAVDEVRDLRWLSDTPTIRVIGLFSLATLVLNSSHDRVLLGVAVALLTAALLRPAVMEQPGLWFAIAAVFGTRHLLAWEGIDNHVILTTYWCLAFACALVATRPLEALARSGRLLIGLAFLFATGWKVATPTFVNSDFFQFTILADERFRLIGTLAGVGSTDRDHNRAALEALAGAETTPATVELIGGSNLVTLAVVLTLATIVIEGLVALAYLLPLPARHRWIRPASLAGFAASTYLLVPVTGFAAVLITMTFADPDLSPGWRRFLLLLLGALAVYTPLWRLVVG